jgi:hypothetical protein
MKKNKNDIDTDLDVDIDIDESSELWSFRNKDDSSNRNNKKEVSNIDILTQKVNQTLIKSTHKKHNIISEPNLKYFEEENKNLDFFKQSVEKELEIFESERKLQIMNKNKDKKNLMNLNMTLSELNLGKGVFVTKDDIIVNLPSNFLNNTNSDDIGNEYIISMNEIERLIPTDDYVAKLHHEYSKDTENY